MKTSDASPVRTCCRRGCNNRVFGQQQVCDACHAKDLLCATCGSPHMGPVPTTKLCPPCRALRRRKHRKPGNPAYTPEEDALIQEAYAKYHAREAGARLRAAFPTRPNWSIKRRAQLIGAATVRAKEPPWSPQEDAILAASPWMTAERLAVLLREQGFSRTITAIVIRRKRARLKGAIDGLTAKGLAEQLNVDVHAVTRWINEGKLAAVRSGLGTSPREHWHIETNAIRAFLLRYPELYELSKLERSGSKLWYLSLITGGAVAEDGEAPNSLPSRLPTEERTFALYGERLTITALADISGRSVPELLDRIDGRGLSVHEAAFGPADADDGLPVSEEGLNFGKALRAQMNAHGVLTAAVLAKSSGVPRETIKAMLAGRVPPTSPQIGRLAKALGADVVVAFWPAG